MPDDVEVRHLVDTLRADLGEGRPPRLHGYAIRTGVSSEDLGGFVEIIAPQAVRRALEAPGDLVALRNHDALHVLGRRSAKTLRVEADEQGLHFEVDVPEAERGLVESVARGDLPGASFAFTHAVDEWNLRTTPPTRTITSMVLREISAGVVHPAYPQASVALRSLDAARQTTKELEMPEPTITAPPANGKIVSPPVADPVPPVPPIVHDRASRDVDPEVRVLGHEDSFRSWIEERSHHPKEYGALRLGDVMAAMIRGPRNELERRVLAEGADATGGITVPDITLAPWIDRLRTALVIVQAGAVTIPLSTDTTKMARLATDPTAAWRSENQPVAESDPAFEGVTFTPRSLDVFFKTSRELVEDSINIADMLEATLVRAFAVEIDRVCLYGTGTPPQPRGLRTTTNVKELSQGTNGLALASYDPLLDLLALLWAGNVTAVDTAIMAPRTLTTISKFKEATTNAPLARPSVLADWRFLQTANVPINETQGSSSLASSLFMGDWSQMMLGFRTQMQVEVARELFRGNVQLGYFGHLRFDVQVTHPESFARLIGII